MIELLARIFIPDRDRTEDPAVRRAYGVLCGVLGVVLNVLLFAAKWAAGLLTGSIAVQADAFNNLSDAASSVVTLAGFRISGKRKDAEHPFGHGRVEYIAGLIVAMLIILMGFDLGKTSVMKILKPSPVAFSTVTAWILAGSVLVKIYMALYSRKMAKKIGSVAMRAVMTDSFSDAAATFAVLASSVAGHLTGLNPDAWTGMLVSLLILRAGVRAAGETISPLLGNPPDPDFVARVMEIVTGHEIVRGVHDLIVHDYGAGRVILSLHAEVPGDGDLMEMHNAIDAIERRLASELHCQAVIHMDPVATDDLLVRRTLERLETLLREEVNPEATVHDFRMIASSGHTNLLFDVVVPLDDPRTGSELRQRIRELVRGMDESYFAVVTIDHPYA